MVSAHSASSTLGSGHAGCSVLAVDALTASGSLVVSSIGRIASLGNADSVRLSVRGSGARHDSLVASIVVLRLGEDWIAWLSFVLS